MKRREFFIMFAAAASLPLTGNAQREKKVFRLGHLLLLSRAPLEPFLDVFQHTLRDLGYVEGSNL